MLIDLQALSAELPAIASTPVVDLCEHLASLGFPVDGVEEKNGRTVLDVDVTANRGDALSHRGLARDLAAKLDRPLTELPTQSLQAEGEALFPVRLEDAACSLYATAILDLGDRQQTPEGVVSLLAVMGSSAKNLAAVDASNLLLHRYGHPTHAFDADTLKNAVIVRRARAGESLVTLDGVTRTLTAKDLVIADEAGPIALAGVMGGDATKVTPATRRVLLESAYFEPRVVRCMAHRHGLHTDASYRFGRGVDPAFARTARDLLVMHLQAWAGARLQGAWTVGAEPAPHAPIQLAMATLNRIAGASLEAQEASALLRRLGCTVDETPDVLHVTPPSWRHDLNIPEDLAEEVLRLRGYEHIGSALPTLQSNPMPLSAAYLKRKRIASRLAHLGFCQTVTYGFVDQWERHGHAKGDEPSLRTLGNPLGEDYSLMRGTLLRDLADVVAMNLANGAKDVRVFEIAPVFTSLDLRHRPASKPESSNLLSSLGTSSEQQQEEESPIQETWTLALAWGGQVGGEDPLSPAWQVASEEGKSHLIGILKAIGVPDAIIHEQNRVRALTNYVVREIQGGGRSERSEHLGWMFEISIQHLPDDPATIIPTFTAFSRFPAVERDLSLLVALDQSHQALVEAMRQALQGTTLRDLRCVDVFRHKSLPAGQQAWLMRLRFQAMDRTLTSGEVDDWMAVALDAAKHLGATLRG